MGHQVFQPNAISVEGDSETGNINLSYKMPDGETITVVLPPILLRKTISHLSTGVLGSPNQEVKALGQLFAIRDLKVNFRPPALLTMKYEVEAGAVLETTIDHSDAQRLLKQLSLALSSVVSSPEEIMH